MPKARLLLLTALLSMLLSAASCFSQGSGSAYYDAGSQDLNVTGEQMATYVVFRFDTGTGGRTMRLPSAENIISQIGSPTVGQIFIMAVSADGSNPVSVVGGSGVTVKASAAEVAGNSTQNLYFVLMNTSAGSQAVTVY